MTAFLETPPMPGCLSVGFTAEPHFETQVIEMQSGDEVRNQLWSSALLRFSAISAMRTPEEIYELLVFYRAMGGRFRGFRMKDWSDYKSCSPDNEPAPTDQPLLLVNAGLKQYRLVKVYEFGAYAETRYILKPVPGTVAIARNGVPLAAGVDYTLDTTTGLVIFVNDAGALTWGGEFDVPVRFDSGFPMELISHRVQSVPFTLVEQRRP